jgi:hypothetical protein
MITPHKFLQILFENKSVWNPLEFPRATVGYGANSLNIPTVRKHLTNMCYLFSDWNKKWQGQLCDTQGITPEKHNELDMFIDSLYMETNTLTYSLNN